MYENFYGFREKPFSLLPDSGFLFLSAKHRMALNLLEYGLMNQAGFTVISGDIGTGKTTLIRKLLNQIDPQIRVGLITNTHQTIGDLMQWIALAFELPHAGKNKVQLYHDFMDFIIREYAQGRRTVLIVDEAQNMSAETLEELRMLSNVNADKDQVLQVILVGQRELRDTLKRPDLVQFAQRIGVDYHLNPLDPEETTAYIVHRCKVAGGNPELFSEQAMETVYQVTRGVPRLINLLCDTALVYGFAEQRERIDAQVVQDVARDKAQGGLWPGTVDLPMSATSGDDRGQETAPTRSAVAASAIDTTTPEAMLRGDDENNLRPKDTEAPVKNPGLRVAIAAESRLLRSYLARTLEQSGVTIVSTLRLRADDLGTLDPNSIDVLLVELDDHLDSQVYHLLETWESPLLLNNSDETEVHLSQPNTLDYGRKLREKLASLVPPKPQSAA